MDLSVTVSAIWMPFCISNAGFPNACVFFSYFSIHDFIGVGDLLCWKSHLLSDVASRSFFSIKMQLVFLDPENHIFIYGVFIEKCDFVAK